MSEDIEIKISSYCNSNGEMIEMVKINISDEVFIEVYENIISLCLHDGESEIIIDENEMEKLIPIFQAFLKTKEKKK